MEAQARVGAYTLLSKIGEGGMGVVHLARRDDGMRVALKVLRPHIVGDDEARQRLAREVSSLSRIRSRWIAEIVDADPWASVPYVATRYVPGLSLHDHVKQEGPIEGGDLLWFAGGLAEGLASVHAVGVLHRDIKPSNVLMEGRTPILIDFGLARVADDPKLTHTGWLLGTPGYLAPEILYGDDATSASDVHSWGATVAYAALGRAPFGRGPSMAIMDRVRRGEHDLTGIDDPLRGVVAAALDPDPLRRPTLDELLAWLGPQTTRPGPLLGAPPTLALAPSSADDSFDMSLALAAQGTRLLREVPPTLVEPPPVRTLVQQWPPPVDAGFALAPTPPIEERVPAAERLRRGALAIAGALVIGAASAAVPWVALWVVLVLVWVLRSGSLAASAVGARRQFRGRRWYDAVQLLIHTPWHLVQSIPGAVMLSLWAGGLAVAAALVCYAVAATVPLTLFVSGVVLAVSLWWGPGGSRFRAPLMRLTQPLSREIGPWFVVLVLLLAAAVGTGLWVEAQGVTWLPGSDRPFASR